MVGVCVGLVEMWLSLAWPVVVKVYGRECTQQTPSQITDFTILNIFVGVVWRATNAKHNVVIT